MKKIAFAICLFVAPLPAFLTSCSIFNAAKTQTIEVQTLKTIGELAESSITLSAKLYAAGTITPAQAREVFDFYNLKFQPAYRVAVSAAKMDVTQLAPADLISLATQLSGLVARYQTTHSP